MAGGIATHKRALFQTKQPKKMLKCVGDKERMPRGSWRICVPVFVHKSVFHKMKNTVIRKRNVFC